MSNTNEDTAYIEIKSFRKRQTIFREGDVGNCMYVVESGRVGILVNYGEPTEKLLTEIEPGGFFGEMGMIRNYPRSATAEALESDTVVAIITWETLGRYFKDSPVKIIGIMQQMGKRIQELSDDYIDACGVVYDLLRQRDALVKENKSLTKKLERIQPPSQEQSVEMPVWREIEGESEDAKDIQFKKYVADYQRCKRSKMV